MASESSTAVAKDFSTSASVVKSRRRMSFLMAQAGIRMLVVAFTLVAISVMVTNQQSVVVFGLEFQAHYTYSSAFKFLVAADAALCSFSALSLIFLYFISRSGTSSLKNYFILFLLDTVMMVLIIAGCAAGTAIGYVGKYGEEHMTWQPTCGYVSKFCNKMSISIAFSYLAFFACLLLNLMSAHALIYRPIH
ncbi:hypothetical protein M0R45_033886 [Rubus argutus]|uniref:CASP-like protein n=1 Tax=Rubus argutus TaxID=59490 RepID=A0AAW1WNK6_RUBAR